MNIYNIIMRDLIQIKKNDSSNTIYDQSELLEGNSEINFKIYSIFKVFLLFS